MMRDQFEKDLRDKLAGYTQPAPPDLWAGIESKIKPAQPAKPAAHIRILRFATIGIAAMVCLLLTPLFLNDEPALTAFSEGETYSIKHAEQPANAIAESKQMLAESQAVQNSAISSSHYAITSCSMQADPMAAACNTKGQHVTENGDADSGEEVTTNDSKRNENEAAAASSDHQETVMTRSTASQTQAGGNKTYSNKYARVQQSIRRTSPVNVSLNSSYMPNSSGHNGGSGPLVCSSPMTFTNTSAIDDTRVMPEANHTTESNHSYPIRVGATMRYPLSQRLSLESGLRYTYLSSSFTTTMLSDDVSQHVSLLGIPVALSYDIIRKGPFTLYATAGGEAAYTIMASDSQDNSLPHPWQFSVNASVGAQYAISDNLGFYIEPGVGYYFDNGSSLETYYTAHPTTFTFNFGFRLNVR